MKTRLLGIVGSLGNESLTRTAIASALRHAESLGAEVRTWDLRDRPLPIFSPERPENEAYRAGSKDVDWANAILLGSPDYHGSMSGVMKNCLDYFWKEFAGKLFGYICASHEKGLLPMEQMRTSVRQCYGWSLPYGVAVTDGDFDMASGIPKNPKLEQRLQMLAHDLTKYAPLLYKQFESDRSESQPHGFASYYKPRT